MAMSFHFVDPLCILRGNDQFRSWEYISTLYLQWLYHFVNIIMDPQCILWRPYLKNLYHSSIGMPALGLKHVIIFVLWLCEYFSGLSASIPFLEKIYKVLHSSSSSNFVLLGAICYTSKLLTSIVPQVSSLQVL
jgi:hypothetical protein